MNNLIPNYMQGWTLASLVIEHMEGKERKVMRQLSRDWKEVVDDSNKRCELHAIKLVNSSITHIANCLKDSFILPENPDVIFRKIVSYSDQIRPQLIRSLEKFSQMDLERFTQGSGRELLEKSEAISNKFFSKISKKGAIILMDRLTLHQGRAVFPKRDDSLSGRVVEQYLGSLTTKLIEGTNWRMNLLSKRRQFPFNLAVFLEGLNENRFHEDLLGRLRERFGSELAVEYEKSFDNDELTRLFNLRCSKVFRQVELAIECHLQMRAILWITDHV